MTRQRFYTITDVLLGARVRSHGVSFYTVPASDETSAPTRT